MKRLVLAYDSLFLGSLCRSSSSCPLTPDDAKPATTPPRRTTQDKIVPSRAIAVVVHLQYVTKPLSCAAFAMKAFGNIVSDGRLVMMSAVQALFEGVMLAYIVLWAPAIEAAALVSFVVIHGITEVVCCYSEEGRETFVVAVMLVLTRSVASCSSAERESFRSPLLTVSTKLSLQHHGDSPAVQQHAVRHLGT